MVWSSGNLNDANLNWISSKIYLPWQKKGLKWQSKAMTQQIEMGGDSPRVEFEFVSLHFIRRVYYNSICLWAIDAATLLCRDWTSCISLIHSIHVQGKRKWTKYWAWTEEDFPTEYECHHSNNSLYLNSTYSKCVWVWVKYLNIIDSSASSSLCNCPYSLQCVFLYVINFIIPVHCVRAWA